MKKGWKNFARAISDSQSSIEGKRKGGENYLKGLVHDITYGAAYPEQSKKNTEVIDQSSTTMTETKEETKEAEVMVASNTMTEEDNADLSLKSEMLNYIAINKLDIPPAVTTAIDNATSSIEVVEELVPLGEIVH